MNKFHLLLIPTTIIVSLFGSNVLTTQAQSNPYLEAVCKGALTGASITGNYSVVPAECRQYMSQPSPSQRQQYNSQDVDRYIQEQDARTRRAEQDAQINLDSLQDGNSLGRSDY